MSAVLTQLARSPMQGGGVLVSPTSRCNAQRPAEPGANAGSVLAATASDRSDTDGVSHDSVHSRWKRPLRCAWWLPWLTPRATTGGSMATRAVLASTRDSRGVRQCSHRHRWVVPLPSPCHGIWTARCQDCHVVPAATVERPAACHHWNVAYVNTTAAVRKPHRLEHGAPRRSHATTRRFNDVGGAAGQHN